MPFKRFSNSRRGMPVLGTWLICIGIILIIICVPIWFWAAVLGMLLVVLGIYLLFPRSPFL